MSDLLSRLFDRDGFEPWLENPEAGVKCASGTIHKRMVAAYAIDTNKIQGAIGPEEAKEIIALSEFARAKKMLLLSINAALSPKIDTGLDGLDACEKVVRMSGRLSEILPQIALVTENVVHAHGYLSTFADLIVTNDSSGESQGAGHIIEPTVEDAIFATRKLIRLLPSTRDEFHEGLSFSGDGGDRELSEDLCQDLTRPGPFDVLRLVNEVLDRDSFLEFDQDHGKSIITGIGKLIDQTVGVCANQTQVAGPIDNSALKKIIEITRLCERFSIPLINLVDTTDETARKVFRTEQGQAMIGNSSMSIRHGAALLSARQMMSPCVSLVVRRCYGAGYLLTTTTRPHHVVIALQKAQFSRHDHDIQTDQALARQWIKKIIAPQTLVEQLVHWVRWSQSQRTRLTEQLHPNDPMRYNLNLNDQDQ